ncbi:type II CRISPR-associated endonuclease Cas1 [Staphylococcus intermedius]|uniref:type II CRISPR-associated endonuclease Cas1 n=1 Tax=Staphylococcus intermedius TaxID=1285 RepID=UPI001EE22E5C|nr:type II CRISPR-associated endonuclease Cas1 [Staphylococcus intermedius]
MKDIIYVENHHFVSVKGESIKFKNIIDKTERYFLLDDVEALIFDSHKSYFSQNLILKCIENDIAILFCDYKHSPVTQILSNFGMVKRLQRIQSQLQFSAKSKDRIWKKIVVCKILNQAMCLENNTQRSQITQYMKALTKEVRGRDVTNREAVAARVYFNHLYGPDFKRGRFDDAINAGLNYGYAVVRSFIKKELALHGYEMSLGIKHQSLENPFNLVDDLIEVYRPFIDSKVYELIFKDNIQVFSLEEKKALIRVLYEPCIVDKKIMKLLDSVKLTTSSLNQCYKTIVLSTYYYRK